MRQAVADYFDLLAGRSERLDYPAADQARDAA